VGLLNIDLSYLLDASARAVRFGETLTIGRVHVFMWNWEVAQQIQRFRRPELANRWLEGRDPLDPTRGFAELLFQALGADRVDSLDYCSFEGCSIVHDLNVQIPAAYRERYDLVYDTGTTEHVFNYPQCLKNCMEAVRVGGTLILSTPMNNYSGHGFYSISPELFYRVLAPENGFELVNLVAFPAFIGDARGYRIPDPAVVNERVQFNAPWPTLMIVEARRTAVCEIFRTWPKQSDYEAVWSSPERIRQWNNPDPATQSLHRRKAITRLINTWPALRIWREKRRNHRVRERWEKYARTVGRLEPYLYHWEQH